jgi:hypothetical protein
VVIFPPKADVTGRRILRFVIRVAATGRQLRLQSHWPTEPPLFERVSNHGQFRTRNRGLGLTGNGY